MTEITKLRWVVHPVRQPRYRQCGPRKNSRSHLILYCFSGGIIRMFPAKVARTLASVNPDKLAGDHADDVGAAERAKTIKVAFLVFECT